MWERGKWSELSWAELSWNVRKGMYCPAWLNWTELTNCLAKEKENKRVWKTSPSSLFPFVRLCIHPSKTTCTCHAGSVSKQVRKKKNHGQIIRASSASVISISKAWKLNVRERLNAKAKLHDFMPALESSNSVRKSKCMRNEKPARYHASCLPSPEKKKRKKKVNKQINVTLSHLSFRSSVRSSAHRKRHVQRCSWGPEAKQDDDFRRLRAFDRNKEQSLEKHQKASLSRLHKPPKLLVQGVETGKARKEG